MGDNRGCRVAHCSVYGATSHITIINHTVASLTQFLDVSKGGREDEEIPCSMRIKGNEGKQAQR